jgi:hypothetical protein
VKQPWARERFTGILTVKQLSDLDAGYLLGLLVGEGHFGGDGRQPQVTLRMHTRHEGVFRWLERAVPGSVLYGPYHHGGRSYFQWMARGRALREVVVPLVVRNRRLLDAHTLERFDAMCSSYRIDVPVTDGSEAEEDGAVVGDVGGDGGAEPEALAEHAEDQAEQEDVEVRRRGQPVTRVLEVEARPEE